MPQANNGNQLGYEKAYSHAVRYLAARQHTVGELQEKLLRRFPPATTLLVLKNLEESDFLNDGRYAQIFVESLKRYKDFGYYGIKAKLHQRKVPTEIAVAALEQFFTLEEEAQVARRFLKKMIRRNRERYDQVARSLAAKGFRTEIVREILKSLPNTGMKG